MMRMLRSRWLWSILGVTAGVWAYQRYNSMQRAKQISVQKNRAMWRRAAARSARTARPMAFNMAARAGRAMVDTTMRTVRAMNRG